VQKITGSLQVGESPARIKELFKGEFGVKISVMSLGKAHTVNKPIEEYEIEEMTDFITQVLKFCDGFGLDVATHWEDFKHGQSSKA
jgi:hypothetical protein